MTTRETAYVQVDADDAEQAIEVAADKYDNDSDSFMFGKEYLIDTTVECEVVPDKKAVHSG
jgi:hypothetical protein